MITLNLSDYVASSPVVVPAPIGPVDYTRDAYDGHHDIEELSQGLPSNLLQHDDFTDDDSSGLAKYDKHENNLIANPVLLNMLALGNASLLQKFSWLLHGDGINSPVSLFLFVFITIPFILFYIFPVHQQLNTFSHLFNLEIFPFLLLFPYFLS